METTKVEGLPKRGAVKAQIFNSICHGVEKVVCALATSPCPDHPSDYQALPSDGDGETLRTVDKSMMVKEK
jgi:hypothetical protein